MTLKIDKDINWRPHLVRLLVLLATSIYLAVSAYIRFDAKSSLELLKRQTQQQQAMNQFSADNQKTFDEYFPIYQHYYSDGRIGTANRLNWIETLNSLSMEFRIPDVQFNLENTRIGQEGETPFYHYDIPIYITDMYLDLKLLHEGDLCRLFNTYAKSANGTFSIEACSIRKAGDSREEFLREGLRAKCQLRWFNLHDLREQWQENNPNAS